MSQTDPALERAREYVEEVRDFYYHLMVYVFVNTILVVVDLLNGTGGPFLGLDWAFWPIMGWGIGVAGHAISVFFGEHRIQQEYRKTRA